MSLNSGVSRLGNEVMVDGLYFESITEGQWYSYFTEVNMLPISQPETFSIGQNRVYTPDFYLPLQDTYVEIKYGNVTEDALSLVASLANKLGKMVMLINGRPKQQEASILFVGPSPNPRSLEIDNPYLAASMGDIREKSFFDGKLYPFSRVIDEGVKKASLSTREHQRAVAAGYAINLSEGEAAALLEEMKAMLPGNHR